MKNRCKARSLSAMMAVYAVLAASSLMAAEPTKDTLPTVKKGIAEEKAILVDVREKREWDQGHISGAIFLPLSELQSGVTAEALAEKFPQKRIIYTHCAAGVRSCVAAEFLEKFGYDVRPLKPGYKDLLEAGFERAEK